MGNNNGQAPTPFKQPPGVPILGQPFQIANLSIPVNCHFTCSHGHAAGEPIPVTLSQPITCPQCRRSYALALNPTNGQVMVLMSEPQIQVVS